MHSLDEFDAEPAADRLLNVAPAGQPSSRALAYLSRAESRLARHRRHSLGAAMRRLHHTARVYLDHTTLIDPNTGETWPTLMPRPRPPAPAT